MFIEMSLLWHANQRQLFTIAGTLVPKISLALDDYAGIKVLHSNPMGSGGSPRNITSKGDVTCTTRLLATFLRTNMHEHEHGAQQKAGTKLCK